jgi:hypothetical protein
LREEEVTPLMRQVVEVRRLTAGLMAHLQGNAPTATG